MFKKYVLVEYLSNVNSIIKQPLQQTQRIKFTSFDVSVNYLVFGATSGGVYIFSRHPCKFIKLVPSKEGSVLQISIAPDERTVALSTIKGLVVVIENCFCDTNLRYQVYTEHEGNTVTAMKWYLDNLYCGDHIGQISVISLTHLLSKAIFQIPCATLMHLDSSVVQLDVQSKFLLVSTKTRTYICNTEQEQYRQIGQKLRDGNYGACFYYTDEFILKNKSVGERSNLPNTDTVKIYCARPGCRLWEANFESAVVCTHQFRNSLVLSPSSIIHLNESTEARLNVSKFLDSTKISENFNFEKIFVLNKFILTYRDDGVYIFDINTVSLLFWTNYFNCIKDLKIVDNVMYIWTGNNRIRILTLIELEHLVLKALAQKQYYLCADLCMFYKDDILNLVNTNSNLLYLIVLNEKIDDTNLLEQLVPLLEKLKEQKAGIQKMKNGIVLVDNIHVYKSDTNLGTNKTSVEEQNTPDTFNALKEIKLSVTERITEGTKTFKEKLQILEATVKNLTTDNFESSDIKVINVQSNDSMKCISDSEVHFANANKSADNSEKNLKSFEVDLDSTERFSDQNYNMNILYRQYQVNKINRNLETPNLIELFNSKNLSGLADLLTNFVWYIKELHSEEESQSKTWCDFQFLRFISKYKMQEIENFDITSDTFNYIVECFVNLNKTNDCCGCLFPLPTAHTKRPQYYDIGCELINKFWTTNNSISVCTTVPYMYEYLIGIVRKNDDIVLLLPLLVQYSDINLLSNFCDKFSYDMWDDAIKLLIKIKGKVCLNCERKIQLDQMATIHWTDFGKLMVNCIGAPSTIKLLMRYSKHIPSGQLNSDFYQCCIFMNSLENTQNGVRNKAGSFIEDLSKNENMNVKFDDLLMKYLNKKYNRQESTNNKHGSQSHSTCSFCETYFESPILEDSLIKLNCGHFCHTVCLSNKEYCKGCSIKL